MEEMIDRCEIEEYELLAVVAKKIWFRRNNVVHGGVHSSNPVTIGR
jgi:hypothetical protein